MSQIPVLQWESRNVRYIHSPAVRSVNRCTNDLKEMCVFLRTYSLTPISSKFPYKKIELSAL